MKQAVDLDAISARYGTARMAGQAMDPTEGDGQIDRGRVSAVLSSWQDVWDMAQEIKALRARAAKPPKVDEILLVKDRVVILTIDVPDLDNLEDDDPAIAAISERLREAGAVSVIVRSEGVHLESLKVDSLPPNLRSAFTADSEDDTDLHPQVEVEGRIHGAKTIKGLWTPMCYLEPGWRAPMADQNAYPEQITCPRCLRMIAAGE